MFFSDKSDFSQIQKNDVPLKTFDKLFADPIVKMVRHIIYLF